MNIHLFAIGKMKKGSPEFDIMSDYIKQCKWPIKVREFEEKKTLSIEELKKAESNLLLKNIPEKAFIIAMDEKGKEMTSREFCSFLTDIQNQGFSDIVFLIGGANGHTDFLRQKAHFILSMGKMTMPHMLARTVLTEQIFRACCIAHHHPYHRD